ncbi:MAG: hypothetical protein M0Z56_02310, partial [Desulfobacteraceae bacterium]|nr:hypothetical protein [Desulfobacteraceae bacterium]
FTSVTPIDLVPFTLAETFSSPKDAGKWMMGYWDNPSPIKAIDGLKQLVQTDPTWVNDNLDVLAFFRKIYSNNPFLLKNMAMHFNSLPINDKKKFLLISALSGDASLTPLIGKTSGDKELIAYADFARTVKFPDVNGDITTTVQLNILWSEFLATGKYDPVKKIVSALSLKKYDGVTDKLNPGGKTTSEQTKKQAAYEATYRSAIWSLTSNCKQIPLVLKYCAFMYERETLAKDVRDQLGILLHRVQKELKEKRSGDNVSA